MSTRQKWLVTILGVFLTCSHFYETHAVAKYQFYQQFDNMCMIAPMLNLPLVERYCRDEKLSAYTRREWFVKSYDALRVWHRTLSNISGTALSRYLHDAIENGPMMPHFYNNAGEFAFTSPRDYSFIPYFLVEYTDKTLRRDFLGLKYPFVLDNDDHYKVFFDNKGTGIIQTVDLGTDSARALEDFRKQWLAHYGENNSEPCIEFFPYMTNRDNLGFKGIFVDTLCAGYRHDDRTYKPYMYGLYKLMLLKLGLNNRNEEMSRNADGELFLVHEDLSNRFEQDSLNPWHHSFFTKDKFLQYAIAEIFKRNQSLFEQTKQTIDFYFSPWKLYCDLKYGNVYYHIKYDKVHSRMYQPPYTTEDVERFLPGDEQMMASMVTLSVRLLLYGACSHGAAAFYNTTSSFCSFDIFKNAALKKKTIGSGTVSFIDTWQEIVSELHSKYSNRDNWISFDGHGWVASFKGQLLQRQRAIPGVDRELLDKLGVAIIESWHGSEMSVFYKIEE